MATVRPCICQRQRKPGVRAANLGKLAIRPQRNGRRPRTRLWRSGVVGASGLAHRVWLAGFQARGTLCPRALDQSRCGLGCCLPGAVAGVPVRWRHLATVACSSVVGSRACGGCTHLCCVGWAGFGAVLERGFAAGVRRAVALPDHGQSVIACTAPVYPGGLDFCAYRCCATVGRAFCGRVWWWRDGYGVRVCGDVLVLHGVHRR